MSLPPRYWACNGDAGWYKTAASKRMCRESHMKQILDPKILLSWKKERMILHNYIPETASKKVVEKEKHMLDIVDCRKNIEGRTAGLGRGVGPHKTNE